MLFQVWNDIIHNKQEVKNLCKDCPLSNKTWEGSQWKPFILKPENIADIKIMVITEGPNRRVSKEQITSIASHPTFTFLSALFEGKFIPIGPNASAYWTHTRKCFINGDKEKGNEAIKQCKKYLKREIQALTPKLIICIGASAYRSLFKDRNKLSEIFVAQNARFLRYLESDVIVIPHPSGLNRFWIDPPKEAVDIFRKIQDTIARYM